MKTCPRCGKQYDDDQAYCGVDGASLSGTLRTPGPRDSRTLAKGAAIGAYKVEGIVGKGGMGIVYAAEHSRLAKRVAIKVLRAELVEDEGQVARFFHEARAANSVGHENIVEVHDFIEEGPYRAYVMELLEGAPLSRELASEEPLAPQRVARIGRQIADALAAVHTKKIVHRDLKPDNIFLVTRARQTDFVKLLDFGVAKLLENDGEGLTQAGTILGTPAYMAPEQLKGDGVDARADIYSLGVILYQMTSGKRPFKGKSIPELMMKQMSDPPPPLANGGTGRVPAPLEKLIFQCLEKDRERRPADMREVESRLHAIEQMVGVLGLGPYPSTSSGPVRPSLAVGESGPSRAPVRDVVREAPDAAQPTPGTASLSSLAAALPTMDEAEGSISAIASRLEAPRAARSPSRLVAAVGVVAAVMAGAAGLWFATRGPTVADPPTALALHVDSDPTGAEIRFGGSALGVTPADLDLTPAWAGRELELWADGRAPSRVRVPDGGGRVSVSLAALDAAPAPPRSPPAPAGEPAGEPAPPIEPDEPAPPSVEERGAAGGTSDDPTERKRRVVRKKRPPESARRPAEVPVDPFQ